jgi:Fe-S-cluster containining protein
MPNTTANLDVEGVPECTRCGACCFSSSPRYLRVFGCDYERLGDEAERLTHFIDNRAYMRLAEGHCAALTYEADSARFLCSIYERRPDVCRALERGSGQCAADRAEKSEEPLVMIRRARR